MLGERVEVISRSTNAGIEDTWVLELRNQLTQRPVLRRAHAEELLDQPGTTVRVLLGERLVEASGHISLWAASHQSRFFPGPPTLDRLITFILPCSEVSVWVHNEIMAESPKEVIGSRDWLTMPGSDLLFRISGIAARDRDPEYAERAKRFGPNLRPLTNSDGQIVARACLLSEIDNGIAITAPRLSVVTTGPARTGSSVYGAAGVFCGLPSSAARNSGPYRQLIQTYWQHG
jgi:hypothetical protein